MCKILVNLLPQRRSNLQLSQPGEKSNRYMSICCQVNMQARCNFVLAHFEYFAGLGDLVERLIQAFK